MAKRSSQTTVYRVTSFLVSIMILRWFSTKLKTSAAHALIENEEEIWVLVQWSSSLPRRPQESHFQSVLCQALALSSSPRVIVIDLQASSLLFVFFIFVLMVLAVHGIYLKSARRRESMETALTFRMIFTSIT